MKLTAKEYKVSDNIYIIAGDRGSGKSIKALSIAQRIAHEKQCDILITRNINKLQSISESVVIIEDITYHTFDFDSPYWCDIFLQRLYSNSIVSILVFAEFRTSWINGQSYSDLQSFTKALTNYIEKLH